ncbi:lon-related putative ATP-dependent protease [Nitrosomonas aestuarii]|uniref:endopeptidase La n=1 Tax=Nitrosomonas aestuarii TaxID=52441 RepID=A0A1I3XRQ2_9PROT|nr:AAA family ATPase [Nitrosomonas aestuarii]SFK22208.1 lon-related putative ATP-dependent protease [Nitrosomonas aestuarii]
MIKPLATNQLYTACDIDQFDFDTTEQLDDLQTVIGQDRAIKALHLGVNIQHEGYNLFVLGPTGLGKHAVVREYLESQSKSRETPPDWVYVNNFDKPSEPIAISLASEHATIFRDDMHQLVEDLCSAIPNAFETDEYHLRLQEIDDELKKTIESAFSTLNDEAQVNNMRLLRTPHGFAFAPVKNNEVIKPKEFDALPEKERRQIEETINGLEEKLATILRMQPQWQREARNKIKELNREVVMFASGHLIDELKNKYQHHAVIRVYLEAVQQDVINNLQNFRREEDASEHMQLPLMKMPAFRRYEVNIIVDHTQHDGGVPVVFLDLPNYANLIGAVEHTVHMGALQTDFTLIKAGALHQANGGYLIIDAIKLLMQPYAWEGLKRALLSQQIKIQSLGQIYSIVNTAGLEPEPIPLRIKVVLIGDRMLYYLLHAYDAEFKQLFKVAADFDDRMQRTDESQRVYAKMIAGLLHRHKLRPFDRLAVARTIEYGARLAGDAEKLSINVMEIADLLCEADHYAGELNQSIVKREDVQRAIDAQIYRGDRIRTRLQEAINRGILMIDTGGAKVGQINGLAVMQLGDVSFAIPSRITATTRLGGGKVVDIERETKLGGAIHSKGVLILSSFLAERFAKDYQLSFSASLVFEQSYGRIEGDSASMAELCGLLSALSNLPIQQGIAMTGSVNQRGEAQVIGGVNEKIEGFFDICRFRGFTEQQGVLIPVSNMQHLMLRDDVIQACENRQFAIYAYSTVDEAMEVLTGETTARINARVEARLHELERIRQRMKKNGKETANDNEKNTD